MCRIGKLLRRLELTLGMDDLGATGPLGLGLGGNRADHALIEVDVLDLDVGNLVAPGFRVLVQDDLNIGIELLALGKHVVELVLAQHGT